MQKHHWYTFDIPPAPTPQQMLREHYARWLLLLLTAICLIVCIDTVHESVTFQGEWNASELVRAAEFLHPILILITC